LVGKGIPGCGCKADQLREGERGTKFVKQIDQAVHQVWEPSLGNWWVSATLKHEEIVDFGLIPSPTSVGSLFGKEV